MASAPLSRRNDSFTPMGSTPLIDYLHYPTLVGCPAFTWTLSCMA
jgi:hypothetical protein